MAIKAHAKPLRAVEREAGKPSGSEYRPVGQMRVREWQEMRNPAQIGRWQALAQCAIQPNPFYEHWFLLPSLAAHDGGGQVKLLCLEVDGQLAGMMPIRRQSSYYGYPLPHIRNWLHSNAFCGQPLIAPGVEVLFWREMLKWCDAQAGSGLFLHLTHMPTCGVQHQALKLLLSSQERPAATVAREERAMLATRLSAESYLEKSLSQKKRKEFRRQRRRLGEEGDLQVVCSRDGEDVANWAEQFLQLELGGWKGEAGSALACDSANAAMFRQVLEGAAQEGKLERLTLNLNDKPIAMLATLLSAPGAFSFKTAFDEQFSRFSPGVLLQLENLALAEDPDIDWVDSCAVEDHKMIDHLWREKRPMACHSIGIGGALRRSIFEKLVKRETGMPAGGII